MVRHILLLGFMLFVNCLEAASPEATYAENGLVTSRSVWASQAGLEMMQAGGNAVDAAVATGFALAVAYPSAGNIGGGGFAVVRLADGQVVALDHRETAPAAAHKTIFQDEKGQVIKGLSTASHLASGVPGSVDGLLLLLETYGTKKRKEVMAPAIRLAEKGFPLSWDMARQFKRHLPDFEPYPASVEKFTDSGRAYEVGEVWKQPDLARTLKRIAREGRDGFYKGKVAELIVNEMQRGGGLISQADLVGYASVWREPIRGTYRGYTIYSMPPPSSGGVLLVQMLNMLEPWNLGNMGWGAAQTIHLMIEAERRAYADRAEHLGDPDFYPVPVAQLIDKQYAIARFADMKPDRASSSEAIGAGNWPEESPETTHFSVMDKSGMMVAFTTTLNRRYGSKIVVPGTGILLNNEMDDFSAKENTPNAVDLIGRSANAVEPGKRMLSSMTPTIVTKGDEPFLVTGSPGGSTIITTVLQVIINTIDHGMTVEDAVSLPRFHHQWKPDRITHEKYSMSPDTLQVLRKKGHNQFIESRFGRGIGDANTILYKDGLMQGVKDPRGEGAALGY